MSIKFIKLKSYRVIVIAKLKQQTTEKTNFFFYKNNHLIEKNEILNRNIEFYKVCLQNTILYNLSKQKAFGCFNQKIFRFVQRTDGCFNLHVFLVNWSTRVVNDLLFSDFVHCQILCLEIIVVPRVDFIITIGVKYTFILVFLNISPPSPRPISITIIELCQSTIPESFMSYKLLLLLWCCKKDLRLNKITSLKRRRKKYISRINRKL